MATDWSLFQFIVLPIRRETLSNQLIHQSINQSINQSVHRHLGLLFSEKLSMTNFIDGVLNSAFTKPGLLKKNQIQI